MSHNIYGMRMLNMEKIFLIIFLIFSSPLTFGFEISLEEYLKKVEIQNLNLKLEIEKQKLTKEKSIGLRIPPPMFALTKGKEEQGASPNGIEITQEVPFPTKLSSNHSAREIEYRAQQEFSRAIQYEILSKAKFSYIDLWITQEKLGTINQKKKILEDHIKLTRSAVRSDSFFKIHLLKAESDLDLLENEIESTKQLLKEKKYILAEIINESPQSFDIEAVEPQISSIPLLNDFDATPQIASMKLTLDSLKSREDEAKASWLPDFNLRYKEMGATSMANKYREVMVGITLPFIYFWETKTTASAANIEKLQAEINLNKERRNIDVKYATLSSKVESLQKQLLNLKKKLIPRAEQRMKLVYNLAPRDMETIQDHRETMDAFPNLRLTELELRMKYEETISELEKYIVNKGPIQ